MPQSPLQALLELHFQCTVIFPKGKDCLKSPPQPLHIICIINLKLPQKNNNEEEKKRNIHKETTIKDEYGLKQREITRQPVIHEGSG